MPAQTRCQSVIVGQLHLNQPIVPVIYTGPTDGSRYMRLKAEPGQLAVRYDATVDIAHHTKRPGVLRLIRTHPAAVNHDGIIHRGRRLGGMLNFYYLSAA